MWRTHVNLGHTAMSPGDLYEICQRNRDDHASRRKQGVELHKYELYWAEYFVREAEELQERASMTEEERRRAERSMEKLYPLPKELYVCAAQLPDKAPMLEMWWIWQRRKRGLMPILSPSGSLKADEDSEEAEKGLKKERKVQFRVQ